MLKIRFGIEKGLTAQETCEVIRIARDVSKALAGC
jgi:hypothetical protein